MPKTKMSYFCNYDYYLDSQFMGGTVTTVSVSFTFRLLI